MPTRNTLALRVLLWSVLTLSNTRCQNGCCPGNQTHAWTEPQPQQLTSEWQQWASVSQGCPNTLQGAEQSLANCGNKHSTFWWLRWGRGMLGPELSFSHGLTLLDKFTCRVGTIDVCLSPDFGGPWTHFVFRKEIIIFLNVYHVPGTVTVLRRPLFDSNSSSSSHWLVSNTMLQSIPQRST